MAGGAHSKMPGMEPLPSSGRPLRRRSIQCGRLICGLLDAPLSNDGTGGRVVDVPVFFGWLASDFSTILPPPPPVPAPFIAAPFVATVPRALPAVPIDTGLPDPIEKLFKGA